MANLSAIDTCLDPDAATCRVIIETPKGSRVKYTYDPEISACVLSGQLPAGLRFPLDFGFVPRTLADDGDPLDILVLGDEPAAPGCVAHVRILGVIEARQTERDGRVVRNDRLVARLDVSVDYARTNHIDELGGSFVEHLGAFFVTYNMLKQKHFEVIGTAGPERAIAHIQQAAHMRLDAMSST